MKISLLSVMGLCAVFAVPAAAHTDEYLDTMAGQHGGQLRMAGTYHLEMVTRPDTLQIYVTDHAGQPQPVEGVTASALLLGGDSKQHITLLPIGANLLEGPGRFDAGQPVKAVVNVQWPGQALQQVWFDTAKHKPADAHAGHH